MRKKPTASVLNVQKVSPALVQIEWLDAADAHPDWEYPAEFVSKSTMFAVKSVGYILHADEHRTILATNMSADGLFSGGIVIPTDWITDVAELVQVPKKRGKK